MPGKEWPQSVFLFSRRRREQLGRKSKAALPGPGRYLCAMRFWFLAAAWAGLLAGGFGFSACDARRPNPAAPAAAAPARDTATVAVTDDLGRPLRLPARPRRLLALAPSMTEMLFAVADPATIIGRTTNCNFPAAAAPRPAVQTYPLDLEAVLALRPDVVFTVEGMTAPDDARRLGQLGIAVYYQRYRRVEDVFRGLTDLGRLLGRPAPARRLTDSLRTELRRLTADAAPAGLARPRVLALASADPIYAFGQNTLFTDEIRLAGGQNAIRETFPQPYPALTREYVLKLNPDLLLGGRRGQLDSTLFRNNPELRRIRAYQTGRIFPVADDLITRPSPRVVETVRQLRNLIKNLRR